MANNKNMFDTVSQKTTSVEPGGTDYLYKNNKTSNIDYLLDNRPVFKISQNIRTELGNYGVGESKYDTDITSANVRNLQNIRAEKQGPLAQFGSFLNQAVVGELIGGSIAGIGYLGDIGEFSNLLSGEDTEFGNAVSRFGESIRDWTKEATPIYEYNYREGEFRPWDWSWWMTNGASIASTLALMVPSGAVAALPGKLAKSLSFASKFSSARRFGMSAQEAAMLAEQAATKISRVVTGLSQAVVSRQMESMMEGKQTYDSAYENAIAAGKSENEAKMIAAKAAKTNYVANWAMLVQDVPQYLFLNKYLGKFARGAEGAAAKKLSTSAKNALGQKVSLRDYIPSLKEAYNIGTDMLGEAGEEAYQYFSNEYGLYKAEQQINPNMDAPFLPWMKENLDMGNLLTSSFFGAFGAGVMQFAGQPLMDKLRGAESPDVMEIKTIADKYATIGKNILDAQKAGDDYKLSMELSKGGAELGIRAAMRNSRTLLDAFIDLLDSGDFSTASKDLKGFAESDEGKAILAQDRKNASSIKDYANKAYDLYNETLANINQEGHTFNKGFNKALENLNKTGRQIDPEWYKTALASSMASASMSKQVIDDTIDELSDELEKSHEKYKNSANQAFKELSEVGVSKLFTEIQLDALRRDQARGDKMYSPEVLATLPDKAKGDIAKWKSELQSEINKLENAIQVLDDNYTDEDRKKDSKIKVNKEDFSEYKEFAEKMWSLKRDSYIYGQALKRYNNGELLSDKEIERYSKEFEDRQDDKYKNGLQQGDVVTIGQDGSMGSIENVNKKDGKITYSVREFAIDENGNVEKAEDLTEYDEDDLWLYDTTSTFKNEEVDTVSSTINDKSSDPNAELRSKLHDKKLNDPLMTLADMVSVSHIDENSPNEVINRDPKLNSVLSTPISEKDIAQLLANGHVEYTIDLSDDQKFWEEHKALKNRIIAIKAGKGSVESLMKHLEKGVTEEAFNFEIDAIPIKVTVTLKDGDTETKYSGTGEYNLYVHNSDFWNVDAPVSIYMDQGPEQAEEYIKQQRIKTRELRVSLVEKLLNNDIVVSNGLRRLGGHLNRVATFGTIQDRLGVDLSEVDLWVGLNDAAGEAYPYLESGVKGEWRTEPGSVLFSTDKTLTGEQIFIPATISNLSKEHAAIIWDCFTILSSGFGYSTNLVGDNVSGVTVGEALDLLVAQGERVSSKMKDKNQVLYLKDRKELHFGNQVIYDITKATPSQRGKFIAWANKNKKYRVPFEVKLLGMKLNSPYRTKSGFRLGSFIVEKGDKRTWAQVLMSSLIEPKRHAIVTNVERVRNEETGEFRESVIHTPSLQVIGQETEPMNEVIQQTEETKPSENINEILGNSIVVGDDDTVVGFYRNPVTDKESEKISDAEFAWLNNRLKSGSTTEMSDRFIDVVIGGQSRQAYGLFKSSAIYLYSNAPKGTVYHEAFHRVSLMYLSTKERERYYASARKKYNMPDATNSEIEEKLAEEFRAWRNHIERNYDIKGMSIFNWIKSMFGFIVHYFTGANALTNYEVEALFRAIDNGYFRNRKVSKDRLKELEGIEAPLEISTIGEGMVDVPFINNRNDYNDFIKGLSHILIVQNGVRDLADIQGMQFSKMTSYIFDKLVPSFEQALAGLNKYLKAGKFDEGYSRERVLQEISYYEGAIKLYNSIRIPKYEKIYKAHIKKILNSEYSINFINDRSDDQLEENDEEFLTPQELITRYGKESFELNIVDNVTANVKFLIATLPASQEVNPITKTVKFVKFSDTWYNLLFHLHDKDSIESMMEELKRLGTSTHAYNVLYKRLERGTPNLRNQFKVAVNKHKHMFINFTFTKESETESKKGNVPTYSIFRADISRAEEEEKYSWVENFLNSDYMIHGSKAGDVQKLNVDKLNSLFENYVAFQTLVEKNSRKQLNPIELEGYKANVLKFLNALSISVDMLTLDTYLLSKVKEVNKPSFGIRQALYALITSELSYKDGSGGYFSKLKELSLNALEREQDLKSKKTARFYDLDADIRALYVGKESLFVIRQLARKMYDSHPDLLNDVVIGPNGNQYFTYALNSYTTDKIKQYKDKEFVDSKLSKIGNKHSLFLQQLSEDDNSREKLSIRTMSSFQERDAHDAGSKYEDLNTIEDYVLRLGCVFNRDGVEQKPLVPFPIIADRGTYYFLDGLKLPQNIYTVNPETNELEFTDEIVDVFLGYAEDERERIEEAKKVIKKYNDAKKKGDGSEKTILDNEMILNYHYKLKGGEVIPGAANATKYIDFNSFNQKGFDFDRDARRIIIEQLTDVIKFGMNRSKSLGVYTIKEDEDTGDTVYENALLDPNIFRSQKEKFTNNKDTIQSIIAYNEISMIISNFEINKLFVGDPAFYKGDKSETIQQDRIKRLMVLTSSGDAVSQITKERGIVETFFTMAALSTQELNMASPEYNKVDSSNYYHTLRNLMIVRQTQSLVRELKSKGDPLYKDLKYVLEENYVYENEGNLEFKIKDIEKLEKDVLKDVFGIDINDILEAYRKVDSTDGQAFVSPEMYRSTLIQLGEWPEWKEETYNLLMQRVKWEDLTDEQKEFRLKFYMQPIKPVFFDLVDNGNIEVPTYLKMSVMPLFPELVDGTKLRDLADRMEAVGKYSGKEKIGMAVYDSAIKVGSKSTTPLYTDQYEESVSDFSDMTSVRLPFSSLRRQLVTDPHNITETKFGTQVIKVSLADLVLDDAIYDLPGVDKKITGSDIANIVFSSLASISDKGLVRLKEKLGYDDKTRQVNLTTLAKTLREDAIKSNMPDLIVDALRTEENGNLYLELDTFSNRRQLFSRLIGMTNKHTIDINMPGNQFIQLSATGLNKQTSDNLKWYGIDVNGNVTAGECAISITLVKHLIPNYSKLNFKDAADYILKNHPEILAYRIPTQGQSSAMYLKVVKLLPETTGDTIILPKAVTALTGSDFDIDKMFVVRHSYFTNSKGELEEVKFYDKAEGDVTPQELAFEAHVNYIISKYKDDIKTLQESLFDKEVPQAEKIDRVTEFMESLKEVIPESLYIAMESILSEMVISELNEDFVGIDKIKELSTLLNNWNYDEAKKQFLEKYKDASPYEYNSEAAIKNRLLDAYLSIYKNTNNIHQSQAPLGSYKKAIKNLAGNIKNDLDNNMFHVYSASNQNILKFEYTGGKDGVGPFALNNSHHVLSQIAGLKYKGKSLGLLNVDREGRIDLSGKTGKGKGNSNIMAWLSALIDAHVDLAKDNYIMKVNVNAATYNFVAFMIRAGFGLNTFKITSQPIIKDLATRINNSGKYSLMALYANKKTAFTRTKQDWINLLSDEAAEEYSKQVLDAHTATTLINIKDVLDGYYNTDVNKLSGKERDSFVLDQLLVFDIYEHFSKMGEDLNNFVQICQVDTKRFGKNMSEIIHYQKRVKDFNDSNRFINADRLFPTVPSRIKNGQSLLGPYYRNSVLFLLDMMPNLTIYSSPGFISIVNSVLDLSGNSKTLNKKLINAISDEVFAAIAGDFFFDVDEEGNPEENSFGLKPRNVIGVMQSTLDVLTKIKYSDEPIARRFRDNPLFSILLKRPLSEDKGLPFTSFLSIARRSFKDTMSTNDYMYGLLDLLTAQANETGSEEEAQIVKQAHQFARRLFVYSFLNSGFRNKLNSFFNIIPPSLFKSLTTENGRELSYNKFIKDKKDLFSSELNTALNVYVDRVFKNNWMNKQIVPTLTINSDVLVDIKQKNGKWRRFDETRQDRPKVLIVSDNRYLENKYKLGENADGDPVFKKYLTYWEARQDKTDINNEPITTWEPHLLQYIGYFTDTRINENEEEEEYDRPIYKVIPRDSFDRGGVVLKTPGLQGDSIIKGANEEGLYIKDGEEQEYFADELIQQQTDSLEFHYVTDMHVVTKAEEDVEENQRVGEDTNKSERTYEKKSNNLDQSLTSYIYSQLGDKTVSGNVRIEPWSQLKDMTEAFTKAYDSIVHIIATRVKGSNEHFGNPFTHDKEIANRNKNLTLVSSTREAVEKYIDWVINSGDDRAKWIRSQIQSGELKDKPILYYKELGEPSHATALDYLINKYDWNKKDIVGDNILEELKNSLNEKFKNQPNYEPLTIEMLKDMTPEQITNLKNCL